MQNEQELATIARADSGRGLEVALHKHRYTTTLHCTSTALAGTCDTTSWRPESQAKHYSVDGKTHRDLHRASTFTEIHF